MATFFLWFLVGALFGVAAIALTRREATRRRERYPAFEARAWALFLLSAALIYLAFAAFGGADTHWTKVEVGGLVAFGLVAALGWRWPVIVGIGWLAHASWDVFVHPGGLPGYVPSWYPPMCLGFDVLVGAALVVRFTKPGRGRVLAASAGVLVLLPSLGLIALDLKVRQGVARAEALFASERPDKLGEIGTTKTLTVLPLIDWHSSDPALRTEMGVSYLIETHEHRVLFDVGHNAAKESPSPLQENMQALGLDEGDFDTIFISHNHFDHVGGTQANEQNTFMLGLDHQALPGKRAFVPLPLTYPGIEPVVSTKPTLVGTGLASTGTIPRQLVFGWIDEQALAVNVEGRGVVLIVGCGHQTMTKLLERYDALFDEPLYGVIGGLHYPVPDGRLNKLGMNLQRRLASGEGLFDPLDMDGVRTELDLLRARNLGLVGVGGHDSSDEVIALFREAFGEAYREVRVGERITLAAPAPPNDGSVLPFAPPPSESVAKPKIEDSTMKWPATPPRLPADAPNILVIMVDDIGFGVTDTFGGEAHTPALTELAEQGIRYNAFHTTSICSPTRAALLTGRNHTRVGSGTIAERAVAFDGYTGVIPKTAATFPEVLKEYGYKTSAFGKWHNTPANETTAMGPKDRWPTGYGFEYFYGFLAGETSQYEPRLYENERAIEPPTDDPSYHLTQDMKERALAWIDQHQAFSPDKPFLMYWAPGAVHGPHQVFKEWADKYEGKFDDGWDAYRERVYRRQLEMGVIPPGTKLTERDATLASWDEIPKSERAFQTRLMEVFAGFVEHTDAQIGELLKGLDARGLRDNTLVIYVVGDNGSSAEGQAGSVSELLAQNQIPNTVAQQLSALDALGGLSALGTEKVDSMYHAGWAWAGDTPFRSTKLVAAHFGGTRNPMVISWPKSIEPDETMRSQFHHVVDIAPTIYEVLGIPHPEVVHGYEQMRMDGISLAYTFADADALGRKQTQFFDNNGSRGVYHEGWFASTFGPFVPWNAADSSGLANWDPDADVWQLYDLRTDFSQASDLSKEQPEKLAEMKALFLEVAEDNKDFPIGAGNWLRLHPEDVIKPPYTEWTFRQNTRRMPEFTAPGLGKQSSKATIALEVGSRASGVIYALGGAGGGLTLYMDRGHLVYEYNMMIIERYQAKSAKPLAPGAHSIEVITDIAGPGKPGTVQLIVDGAPVASANLRRTVPLAFTASETFDVGADLGSPVSPHYAERRPFALDGKIHEVRVTLD